MIEYLLPDVIFFCLCLILSKLGVIEMEMWVPQWLQAGVQDLPDGRTCYYDDAA